jgi:hypothetical protein
MGWRDGTCAHPGIPAALFSAGLYSSSSSTFETGADAKTLRRSTGPDPFVLSADLSFVASLLAADSVTCADAESRCRLGACHRKKGPRAIPLRLFGGAESHLSVSCGGRIAGTAIFSSSFVFDCGDLLLKERELLIKVGLTHLACPCSLAFSFPVCQSFVNRMAPVFSFAVL